jgi:hypothetical protein
MRLIVSSDNSRQAEVHEFDPATRVRDVALQLAEAVDDEVDVLVVDADDPLDPDKSLAELGIAANAEIAILRRRKVKATVSFNQIEHREEFRPQTTMRRVYDWAVGPDAFNLPLDQRPGHELVPDGERKAVDPRLPIAAYVDHGRKANFHLRRKKGFQG